MKEKSDSLLSSRGKAAAEFSKMFDAFGDIYSPDNKNGAVNLAVSENYDMFKTTAERIGGNSEYDPDDMGYGLSTFGIEDLRKALSSFLNKDFSPARETKPEELVVLNGVTSVNHAFAWNMLEKGEKILIGVPSYGAYDWDFKAFSDVDILFVPFEKPAGGVSGPIDPFGMDAVAAYEDAIISYQAKMDPKTDGDIRALLLCNPHNPLGVCYTREVLEAYVRLCAKHDLFLVSDEIYAKSVFNTSEKDGDDDGKPPFTSILSIDAEKEGLSRDKIFVFYGLSKDFACGGVRVGLVHTTSEEARRAFWGISVFHWAGVPAQRSALKILSSEDWLSKFWEDSRASLRSNYLRATKFLKQHHIPYYEKGNSGFYLWIDLRPWLVYLMPSEIDDSDPMALTPGTWERELELTAHLAKHKVLLATGKMFHSEHPGFFRIIFAQEPEVLDVGLERIWEALESLKADSRNSDLTVR